MTRTKKIIGVFSIMAALSGIWFVPKLETPNPLLQQSSEELKKVYNTPGGVACLRWFNIASGVLEEGYRGEAEFEKKVCNEYSGKTGITLANLTDKKAMSRYVELLKTERNGG